MRNWAGREDVYTDSGQGLCTLSKGERLCTLILKRHGSGWFVGFPKVKLPALHHV